MLPQPSPEIRPAGGREILYRVAIRGTSPIVRVFEEMCEELASI
jgi:hypothetical protein